MKKLFMLMVVLLFAIGSLLAQKTITGTISDQSGETLVGANVLVKGSNVGTISEIDGSFSLEVPEAFSTIIISFTGYRTQEVDISSQTHIDIVLGEGELLDEIVVTSLGIKKESKKLGYAIDQIDGEEMTKARSDNVIGALQGKVTGVNITQTSGNLGGSTKIIIRGVTSLSGNNDPLFVIDGMPMNNDQISSASRISGTRDFGNGASVINPDDIESLSVLKGAAATALYGARAAAGAIIITTKRGKSSSDGSARVSINSSYRLDDLFVIPDYQQDFAQGLLSKYDSSQIGTDWGPRNVGQTVQNVPIIGGPGALRKIEDNGVKDFFNTGFTAINNFAISDGTEKMDYRVSFGALNQTGILPGAKLSRYNVSLNAGVSHSERLQSRFGIQFIKTDSEGTGAAGANDPNIIGLSSFSSTTDPAVYDPWIDEAGNQINTSTPTSNNPLWIRHENRNERDDSRVLANMSMTYSPIDKLGITGQIGYDFDQDNRLITNRKGTAQRINGDFRVDKINNIQVNTDILAKYEIDVSQDFDVFTLVGFNYNKRKRATERLVSTSLLVPELFAPGNTEQNVPARFFQEQVLFGGYGSVDVTYKDFWTLSFTGRQDWTSTLPKENRKYFYPSVSTAFVFTDALNISNTGILDYGKFRASYAEVGNDTGPYQLDFVFNPITTATGQYGLNVNFPFNGRLAFAKGQTVPPSDLKPERQKSFEVGVDLDFLDYRLGIDMTYFHTRNVDQILALPIPETTGFSFLRTNVGQVNTTGFEISLDATPLRMKNFIWTTAINFSKADTKVVELSEGVDRVLIASGFNSVQVVAEAGKGFELFAVPFLRDTVSGRPIINPNDGTRLAGEARTFGSVLPDFTMGFINNFSIGPVDISFTVDWKSGGIMKSSTVEALQVNGLVEETLQNREGTFIDVAGVLENADGTFRDNDIPVVSSQVFWGALNNSSVAEPYIFDASFVKLREVAINYTLPKSFLSKTFFKELSIGLEARNVALLYSKVPHIDPEASLFGSGRDGFGIERQNVPSTKSIGVNLRATF
ncbi:MAG: SusC/RagA family TonB-linked outer membrane protein [Saprospiraceae bacterium]